MVILLTLLSAVSPYLFNEVAHCCIVFHSSLALQNSKCICLIRYLILLPLNTSEDGRHVNFFAILHFLAFLHLAITAFTWLSQRSLGYHLLLFTWLTLLGVHSTVTAFTWLSFTWQSRCSLSFPSLDNHVVHLAFLHFLATTAFTSWLHFLAIMLFTRLSFTWLSWHSLGFPSLGYHAVHLAFLYFLAIMSFTWCSLRSLGNHSAHLAFLHFLAFTWRS